jgi:hypothetical protein
VYQGLDYISLNGLYHGPHSPLAPAFVPGLGYVSNQDGAKELASEYLAEKIKS